MRSELMTKLGIRVQELTQKTGTAGVMVSRIEQPSKAMDVGMRCGDIIERVNRRPVMSAPEFEKALLDYHNEPLILRVRRGEEIKYPVFGVEYGPDRLTAPPAPDRKPED